VIVHTLTRDISDHTPLLLDTGMPSQLNKPNMFKFELGWLLKDGFYELVADLWHKEKKGSTLTEKWQNKTKYLRKYLRGWVKNMNGAYKKEKKSSQIK
jgi:hypothetical protein